MNDRLGRFGRRELFSLAAVCTIIFGCFSSEERVYADGNQLHFATLTALLCTLLLQELLLRALEASGCESLGEWLQKKRTGRAFAVLIAFSLLCAAALPGVRFVRAMIGFIYPEANVRHIVLWCLPCLALLALLGMETLARTGRILLPVTLLVTLAGLGSDIPLYRLYRLYPLFSGVPKLLSESAVSLLRFLPVSWMLLTTARGAQGLQNVRFAGRWGLLLGGAVTIAAELCVGLSYRYTELEKLSAPLYRLMLEIDTDNAAVRLDRVVLFAWTMAAMFASACAVYAAALLLCESLAVRDVRPIAALLCVLAASAVLALRGAEELALPALLWLRRIGAAAAALPAPFLIRTEK